MRCDRKHFAPAKPFQQPTCFLHVVVTAASKFSRGRKKLERSNDMKKLAAVIAVTAALATPAFAQSAWYNPETGQYSEGPRTQITVPYANQNLGPIFTQRGVMTDPDPNVRLELHRNFDHYAHGTGG